MTPPHFRITSLADEPGIDLDLFDCGDPGYNRWLSRSARSATQAGTSAVYLLMEKSAGVDRVAGYFAICPTMVVRDSMPGSIRRGSLHETPGWLITKLAVSGDLRGSSVGEQLLREALIKIARSAELGGGRVIAVDAGNPKLIAWYTARGFRSTGDGNPRLFMKVSTARKYLIDREDSDT